MGYYNYYAVKVKKLQEADPSKTIKMVDKDINNIFLEVNGKLEVYERGAFRQMIKERGL